jgi:hypothetical protein
MGRKKEADIEQGERSCPTCSEWGNEDPQEFPCALAKVVVKRKRPRTGCKFWRSTGQIPPWRD